MEPIGTTSDQGGRDFPPLTMERILNCEPLQPTYFRGFICIEGNIGSGKSTLMDSFRRRCRTVPTLPVHVMFAEEPVEIWESSGILGKFYQDPDRWSVPFQLAVLCTQGDIIKAVQSLCTSAHQPFVVVYERTPQCARDVFIKVLAESGKFPIEFMFFYNQIWKVMQCDWFVQHLRGVICVDTPIKECMNRVRTRGRQSEQSNTLNEEYLAKIERAQWEMLHAMPPSVTVHSIDGTHKKWKELAWKSLCSQLEMLK